MTRPVISEMGYIALRTKELDESIEMATEVLGLRVTRRTDERAYLAAVDKHHELVYVAGDTDGVEALGLVAPTPEALAEVRRRVDDRGYRVLDDPSFNVGVDEGFAFVGPEGWTFHIYRGMQRHEHGCSEWGPDRYGHVNIHPRDVVAFKDFLVDVLDFKLSDIIGDDFAFFLRCNPDHHGFALISGAGWLHHHAWQTQSIADLGRLGDRLFRLGKRLIWGPVRHGAGHNIAAYYVEPNGTVVELYTDLEQIYDELRPPVVWDGESRWFNNWGVYNGEDFRQHGAFPVER